MIYLTLTWLYPLSGASDVTYHIQWIILFSAVDDYGIREQNELVRAASPGETNVASHEEIESMKKKLYDDTVHSACRIAGLAGVLTSHGYMVCTYLLLKFGPLSFLLYPQPTKHRCFLENHNNKFDKKVS